MRKFIFWLGGLILLGGLGWRFYSGSETLSSPQAHFLKPTMATRGAPLSFWAWGGDGDEALWQRRAEEFRIQTGQATSVVFYASEEAYRQALKKARETGDLPDVFLIDALEAESLYRTSDLALIDFESHEAVNWLPAAVKSFQRKDKILAWPSDFSLLALYYNRADFDRIGVAYPDVHWNWTILLALSRTLYRPAEGDSRPATYGIEFPLNFDLWQAMARQAGHGIYQGATWQLGAEDGALAQAAALEFMRDYFKVYVVAAPPKTEPDGEYFAQGRAALCVAGPELLSRLAGTGELRWGVTPLPRGEARATTLRTEGWAVSASSRDPFAASQLARFLARQPLRRDWLPAYVGPGAPAHAPEQEVFYKAAVDAEGPPELDRAPEIAVFINRELLRWINLQEPSTKDFISLVNNTFNIWPKQ